MLKQKIKYLKFLFLFFLLVGIDQAFKIYVVHSNFAYQFNRLYILGLVGINNYLYSLLVFIFLFFLSVEFLRSSTIKQVVYIFILSGVISQYISRVYFGGVVDFINVFNITIINIADLYIVIGALFLFTLLLSKKY